MSRVYLSFLGTNDYLPCTYFLDDQEAISVRFVQEATIQFFCRYWTPDDRILIFTTKEAFKKNWLDDGHSDKDGQPKKSDGLKQCLKKLHLKVTTDHIDIPDGKSENEIWDIFQIIFDQLTSGDEVIFDITHAFRSIPMLAIVVLNYAKVLKEVSLKGIYYGAFETLGIMDQARRIPLEDRRVPVFNLTSFDSLLDWSIAIDRFIGSGDAQPVSMLSKKTATPFLKATKGHNQAAGAMRDFANSLKSFSKIMSTCRGRKITDSVAELKKKILSCEDLAFVPPFRPLLEKIQKEVGVFNGDRVSDGIQAAKWCLNHNLIQQGYTILREVFVNYFITMTDCDPQNSKHREIASQAVKICKENLLEKDWKVPARDDPQTTQKYLKFLKENPDTIRTFTQLSDWRNDLDHAGFRENPRKASDFEGQLESLIGKIEKTIVQKTN